MIDPLKKAHSVTVLCRDLAVARSSYYAYLHGSRGRVVAPAVLEDLREIHAHTRQSYGSRRMAKALQNKGHRVGRWRARVLMTQIGARVNRSRWHHYSKADQAAAVAPNLLNRQFDPAWRDQIWVGDIHAPGLALPGDRGGPVQSSDRRHRVRRQGRSRPGGQGVRGGHA
jgi:putative transposase